MENPENISDFHIFLTSDIKYDKWILKFSNPYITSYANPGININVISLKMNWWHWSYLIMITDIFCRRTTPFPHYSLNEINFSVSQRDSILGGWVHFWKCKHPPTPGSLKYETQGFGKTLILRSCLTLLEHSIVSHFEHSTKICPRINYIDLHHIQKGNRNST